VDHKQQIWAGHVVRAFPISTNISSCARPEILARKFSPFEIIGMAVEGPGTVWRAGMEKTGRFRHRMVSLFVRSEDAEASLDRKETGLDFFKAEIVFIKRGGGLPGNDIPVFTWIGTGALWLNLRHAWPAFTKGNGPAIPRMMAWPATY